MSIAKVTETLKTMGAEALIRGFNFEDHGAKFHVFCKKCGKGWSLQKDSRHTGNVLHLLNHEAGHK